MVNNNNNNISDGNELSHLLLFVEEEQEEEEEKRNDRNGDTYYLYTMRSLSFPVLLLVLLVMVVATSSSSLMGTVFGTRSSNSIILSSSSSSSSSLSIVNDNDNDDMWPTTAPVCMGTTNTVTLGLVTCPDISDSWILYGRPLKRLCTQNNCEGDGGTYDDSDRKCVGSPSSLYYECTTTLKCCHIPIPDVPFPVPSSADKKSFHITTCGNLLTPNGRYIDVQDAIREANFNRFDNKEQLAYQVRGFPNDQYSTRYGKNTLVVYQYLWGGSCQGKCVAKGGTPTCTY